MTTLKQRNPYWGIWETLGLGLLIFIVFSFFQSIFLLGYSVISLDNGVDSGLDSGVDSNFANTLETSISDGDAIGIAEIPSVVIGIALILLFTSIPKVISVKEYLKLYYPSFLVTLKWLGIMLLIILLLETINIFLEREVPDFMTDVYNSTDNHIILWIALIIGAPLFEEFLFRGFIFEGLKHSAIGVVGATLVTASSWSIIHIQYGWYEIFTIFLIGIALAIAKHKTQSLYIPLFMHMLMNLTASINMELVVALA